MKAYLVWMMIAGAAAPPAGVDAKELTLLQALRDRRVELDHREAELTQRAHALDQLARELDQRLEGLNQALLRVEARLNIGEPRRAARQKRLEQLVASLEGLSPKKAAPMLAAADPDLVGDILLALGTERTSALLAAMAPPQAGRLVNIVGEVAARAEEREADTKARRAPAAGAGAGDGESPRAGVKAGASAKAP